MRPRQVATLLAGVSVFLNSIIWLDSPLRPSAAGIAGLRAAVELARHGEVLLVSRSPLPWAWAHAGARTALPTRYVRLRIQC